MRLIRLLIAFLWRTLRQASIEALHGAAWAIRQTISTTIKAVRLSWKITKALQSALAVLIELAISLGFYLLILTAPVFIALFPRGDPWLTSYDGFHFYKFIKLSLLALTSFVSLVLLQAIFRVRSRENEVVQPRSAFEQYLTRASKSLSWLFFCSLVFLAIFARLEVLGVVEVPKLNLIPSIQKLGDATQTPDEKPQYPAKTFSKHSDGVASTSSSAQTNPSQRQRATSGQQMQSLIFRGLLIFTIIGGLVGLNVLIIHISTR